MWRCNVASNFRFLTPLPFSTHRKNIMDKLGLKSVSALTIYAVTHGYVDVDKVKG